MAETIKDVLMEMRQRGWPEPERLGENDCALNWKFSEHPHMGPFCWCGLAREGDDIDPVEAFASGALRQAVIPGFVMNSGYSNVLHTPRMFFATAAEVANALHWARKFFDGTKPMFWMSGYAPDGQLISLRQTGELPHGAPGPLVSAEEWERAQLSTRSEVQ